jgi:tetratricopeptide (TPR) repeat protein
MENHEKSGFAHARLPWLIVAGALIVYVLTLNRWVSLASLPVVAGVASKDALPPLQAPVHFLVTFPFRWLPVAWQAVGLNLFAAVCGALTLGLLARSVALLPQDRTREQRQRERGEFSLLSLPTAWVPPLFAALICGLQLSFWEHASAATGEMLDLLLFAYIIRCLFEYRIDQRESWLTRSALVYGIAATNNYAMLGFFPAYLVALIWIKRLKFFEFRFVASMFGWGTVGLTLYLLLPVLAAFHEQSELGFWQALQIELQGEKAALFRIPRVIVLLAGLTSLLPAILIAIRWPSTFGETSPAGAVITTLLFRVVHVALLAAGIWTAFDGKISARSLVDTMLLQFTDEARSGVPFLTFYYLGALCLGYFVGYFLLVYGPSIGKSWQKVPPTSRPANRMVTGLIWLVVIAAPSGLFYKNLPAIRANDGSLLQEFVRSATSGLPELGAIALCDDPYIFSLVQADFRRSAKDSDVIVANTHLMPFTVYQKALHKQFPNRWPALPAAKTPITFLSPLYLIQEVVALARSNEVYYLHPSFGYYFEPLYLQPRGLIYRLQLYTTNAVNPPLLAPALLDENLKFWAQIRPSLDRLAGMVGQNINDARALGRSYSRALNWWGVELQKLGRLDDAAQNFELARKLNPGNVAAEINLNCNQTLRAGGVTPVERGKPLDEKFGRYRDWNSLLVVNGPIDDAGLCVRLGQSFATQSLFRQAALQFTRALQLQPDNMDARFALADVLLAGQIPDKALEVAGEIRARHSARHLNATNLVELARIEAMAHYNKGELDAAEKLLVEARRQFPANETLLDTLAQMYLTADRLTNALAAVEEQLKLKPDNVDVLLNKAYLCMRLESYEPASAAVAAVLQKEPNNVRALLDKGAICIQTKAFKDAVAPLDQALKLQPENRIALMNRAIARLQSDQLDAAKRDYEALQKIAPTLHQVYYGLGEIAFRRKDVPAAINHYEAYLKYAPPSTGGEAEQIAERLKQLKSATGR